MASARWLVAASGLPIAALAVWFGLLDPMPFGEGRCGSCGVEAWVTAAHVAAAVWLGGVVAIASASRTGAGPGPVTVAGLGAVALFVVVSLLWNPPLMVLLVALALAASPLLLPAAAVCWLVTTFAWGRPPGSEAELRRRFDLSLAGAWVTLTLLLPAVYGWVYIDRVNLITF
jgi:hypothetical protein